MSQFKSFTWTNPNPAVAHNLDIGFEASEVTVVDTTNGGSWQWLAGMPDGSVLDVDAGTIQAADGVSKLSQKSMFGPSITGFTNANPGVITVINLDQFGIVAGDTIKVVAVADNGTATTLNGTYTVASVTATTITTTTNTTACSVYVSGGCVMHVKDAAGTPIPVEDKAIRGVTLGTNAVGANSAVMVAVVKGANPVL